MIFLKKINPDSGACNPKWGHRRIGLFGGTFDPPHAGHLHLSLTALKWLQLDFVWWIPALGNPLKTNTPSFEKRFDACLAYVKQHPKFFISDIEQQKNLRTSYDTVTALQTKFSKTDFVWVGGSDLAQEFHRWDSWQDLLSRLPFCFIDRPGQHKTVKKCALDSLSHMYVQTHVLTKPSPILLQKNQIFRIKTAPRINLSSTQLREQKDLL